MIPPTLLTPPILLYTSELIAIAIFYVTRELEEAFEKNDSFTYHYNDDGTVTKRKIQPASYRELIEVYQISCCIVNSAVRFVKGVRDVLRTSK